MEEKTETSAPANDTPAIDAPPPSAVAPDAGSAPADPSASVSHASLVSAFGAQFDRLRKENEQLASKTIDAESRLQAMTAKFEETTKTYEASTKYMEQDKQRKTDKLHNRIDELVQTISTKDVPEAEKASILGLLESNRAAATADPISAKNSINTIAYLMTNFKKSGQEATKKRGAGEITPATATRPPPLGATKIMSAEAPSDQSRPTKRSRPTYAQPTAGPTMADLMFGHIVSEDMFDAIGGKDEITQMRQRQKQYNEDRKKRMDALNTHSFGMSME